MKSFRVLSLAVLLVLMGCEDPQAVYYKTIADNGYIPMKQPMAGVASGTLLRGTPDNLFMLSRPDRCLPYTIDGKPSDLRWTSDTAIGAKHYSATLAFNAAINSIVATGTPAFTFKLDATYVKQVDFDVQDAKVDMVDQLGLQDYYLNGMSDACKKYLIAYPFILNGLVATKMSFTFHDAFGGKISLTTDKIQEIVDISAGVEWHIENNFTLVFTTPKYIGYHLAQLTETDNGLIRMVSYSTKDNAFLWVDLNAPAGLEDYEQALNRSLSAP